MSTKTKKNVPVIGEVWIGTGTTTVASRAMNGGIWSVLGVRPQGVMHYQTWLEDSDGFVENSIRTYAHFHTALKDWESR